MPAQRSIQPFRSGYQNVPCLQARFDHQHLIVENVEETVAFYEGILGAQKTEIKEIAGVPFVMMDMNGTRLTISNQLHANIGSHYGLAVENLDVAVDELKSHGVKLLTEPTQVGQVRYVFIEDVAGNTVELLERKAE